MPQRALVAAPGGRTFLLEGKTVADVRAALEAATGQPLGQQTLCDEQGTVLPSDASLEQESWKRNKSSGNGGGGVVLALRVGGKGGAAPLEPSPTAAATASKRSDDGRVLIRVKPRVQLETWSLYWKETMETRTKELPAFEALYDPRETTVSRVLDDARERLGWEPASELKRLDGFDADWDSAFVRGHRAPLAHTLSAAGLAAGGELVLLRRALEEDGWKVVTEGSSGGENGENGEGGEGDEDSSDFDSDDDYTSSDDDEEENESDEDIYA